MPSERSAPLLGVAAAVGASLCCVAPVLGVAAGVTGLASAFAWAAPLRVPLAVLTLGLLSFAWYRSVRTSRRQTECACDERTPTGRGTLAVVTVAALALLAFPSYADRLAPEARAQAPTSPQTLGPTVRVSISGMTCAGCVPHVETALAGVDGAASWDVSYERAEAVVRYDPARANPEAIRAAIASTGYGAEIVGGAP